MVVPIYYLFLICLSGQALFIQVWRVSSEVVVIYLSYTESLQSLSFPLILSWESFYLTLHCHSC